jgi:hypothetical protein
MLFVNEENISQKDFIKAFGLSDVLGLEKSKVEENNFKFSLSTPKTFKFNDEIMKDDSRKVSGDKKAATRFFPITYIATDEDGDTVSVRFAKSYPTVNAKGEKKFARTPEKWKFEHTVYPGEEDFFLFLLLSPECSTSPCVNKKVEYFHLEDKDAIVKDKVSRYKKRQECEEYISKLSGAALIIKAMGIVDLNKEFAFADKIVKTEGEDSLRLKLAETATKNPYVFAEAMFGTAASGATVSGKIKYGINSGIIKKIPTNMPHVSVWQFLDGTEIARTNASQNEEVFVQDALVSNHSLYQKLEKQINEKLDKLSVKSLSAEPTTSEKINSLLDAEALHYDLAKKEVYWVDNGKVIEPSILKAKENWKKELVKHFEKKENIEYFNAKVKLLESVS